MQVSDIKKLDIPAHIHTSLCWTGWNGFYIVQLEGVTAVVLSFTFTFFFSTTDGATQLIDRCLGLRMLQKERTNTFVCST